jgi:hypothetical protein
MLRSRTPQSKARGFELRSGRCSPPLELQPRSPLSRNGRRKLTFLRRRVGPASKRRANAANSPGPSDHSSVFQRSPGRIVGWTFFMRSRPNPIRSSRNGRRKLTLTWVGLAASNSADAPCLSSADGHRRSCKDAARNSALDRVQIGLDSN